MNIGKLKITTPSADIPIMFGTGTLALLLVAKPPYDAFSCIVALFGAANIFFAWRLKRKRSSAKVEQGAP
jgi:tellurite resistance protein TehA-like permease